MFVHRVKVFGCKDFSGRLQGKDTRRGICTACAWLIVRIFSSCKDFSERQGRNTCTRILKDCILGKIACYKYKNHGYSNIAQKFVAILLQWNFYN